MSIGEMVCQIVRAKKAYYLDGNPIMNDYEYDMLEEDLRKVDPDHPVLYAVGYDSSYEWWIHHYSNN